MKGTIFDIKEFGVHDGPGLVTTVFLKGCPLRCQWCHNPEGQSFEKELIYRENRCQHCGLCQQGCQHEDCQPYGRCLHICPNDCLSVVGEEIEAKQLAERLLKNKEIIDGFTFSGGEPLAQSEFLLEVISYLKPFKINIETSGYCCQEVFKKVINEVDLVYFDIKLFDDDLHRKYTGQSNELILKNFAILKDSGKQFIVRTPLIPSITDIKENLEKIKQLVGDGNYELLPYNQLAGAKYKMLNREYPLKNLNE